MGLTWDLVDNANITGAGSSQFVNLGLLELTSGNSTIDADFYNRGGTIDVQEGTLSLTGSTERFIGGAITGKGTLQGNDVVLDGISISQTTATPTDTRIIGDVSLSSAQLTGQNLSLVGGAALELSNSLIAMSNISGNGEVYTNGVSSVDTYGEGSYSHLTGGIKWINSGTTQLGVDYLPFIRYYIPTNEITLTPGAGDQIVIENEPGASLTVLGGGAAINGPSDGSAMLYNYGTIDNDTGYGGGGSSSISIEVNVVNDGLLETPFVGYDLSGALTGTGTTDVGAGTEINGSVGVGQTLQFRNNLVETVAGYSYSTLTLGNVLQFEGSISGFDQNGVANDAIVVDAVTGAWAYQGFVANSGGTGGSLMFTNGSAEAVVHLSGSYDPNDFQSLVSGYQTAIFYNG